MVPCHHFAIAFFVVILELAACQSSDCPVGKYLSLGYCYTCSNAPDNAAYTGKSFSSACPWSCLSGFEESYSGLSCQLVCDIGYYYGRYFSGCFPCTNGPAHSYYTSSANGNNACSWTCESGYKRESGSCVKDSSLCQVGYYMSSASGSCKPCTNKPSGSDSYYTSSGGGSSQCAWEFRNSYYAQNYLAQYAYPGSWYTDTKGAITAGVVGGSMILIILMVAILQRAKSSHDRVDASDDCCSCINTYNSRAGVFIAGIILALSVLALSAIADQQAHETCNLTASFALLCAVCGIAFLGTIILYGLSSCGCSLCCKCPSDVCNRAIQATTAIGFSLTFWFISLGILTWSAGFVGAFASLSGEAYYGEKGACYIASLFVPRGLIAWGGILSCAALLLQGYFVTLVPEARAYLAKVKPSGQPSSPPAVINVMRNTYSVRPDQVEIHEDLHP